MCDLPGKTPSYDRLVSDNLHPSDLWMREVTNRRFRLQKPHTLLATSALCRHAMRCCKVFSAASLQLQGAGCPYFDS
jgi:hypothetical protein